MPGERFVFVREGTEQTEGGSQRGHGTLGAQSIEAL